MIPWRGGGRRPPATPLAAGAAAAVLTAVLMLAGPPGGDAAAHLYLADLWSRGGWQVWDTLWYSGRHSLVTYGVAYYPLAALVGHTAVVAAAAGVSAASFGLIARRAWPRGAAAATWAFAAALPLAAVAGVYPFLLGLAAATGCLLAVAADRPVAAAVLAVATPLGHPLALAFLVIVLAAVAVAHRDRLGETRWRLVAAVVAAVLVVQYAVVRIFATDGGRYPFDPKDAVAILAFCAAGAALSWRTPGVAVLRNIFVAYGLVTLAALVVPGPVGGNAVRLMVVAGAALLIPVIAARGVRPGPVALACLAGTLFWQVLPTWTGWRTAARAEAAEASYWNPVVDLALRAGDPGHRLHVVATADNWEAWHVAGRGIPITRGWFRQDDRPPNAILYERPLRPERYVEWMRLAAVRYVALPDDPLDYSAREEARVLRAGVPGLRVARRTAHWTVYRLTGDTPMVTPADGARVTGATGARITIRVERPGTYRVALRYTPHMTVSGDTAGSCVSPAEPWGVTLRAARAGDVTLGLDVTPGSVLDALLGRTPACPGRGSP